MTGLRTDGFEHHKAFFSDLSDAERAIAALYRMQAAKIGDHQWNFPAPPYECVTYINRTLERDDKEALYQVQKMIGGSNVVRSIFDGRFHSLVAGRLGCEPNEVLIEGPGLFVSRPGDVRLKYKWHSEAHYYPKRRRFLNVWCPIFTDRTLADGAMSILPRSHLEQWDFAEYVGFNKETEGRKNHFVQYEIPEAWLVGYTPHHCESQRGDMILFDRNLVHRSNINTTDQYSYSIVARAWTPKDDLTLSGLMSATPYGGDIGRADLTVKR